MGYRMGDSVGVVAWVAITGWRLVCGYGCRRMLGAELVRSVMVSLSKYHIQNKHAKNSLPWETGSPALSGIYLREDRHGTIEVVEIYVGHYGVTMVNFGSYHTPLDENEECRWCRVSA